MQPRITMTNSAQTTTAQAMIAVMTGQLGEFFNEKAGSVVVDGMEVLGDVDDNVVAKVVDIVEKNVVVVFATDVVDVVNVVLPYEKQSQVRLTMRHETRLCHELT